MILAKPPWERPRLDGVRLMIDEGCFESALTNYRQIIQGRGRARRITNPERY